MVDSDRTVFKPQPFYTESSPGKHRSLGASLHRRLFCGQEESKLFSSNYELRKRCQLFQLLRALSGVIQPPAQSSGVIQPPAQSSGVIQPPAQSSDVIQPPAQSSDVIQPPAQSRLMPVKLLSVTSAQSVSRFRNVKLLRFRGLVKILQGSS